MALSAQASAADGNMQAREINRYPFFASAERAAQIRQGYPGISAGMTPTQVANILGEPDEIRPLYEPKMKAPKLIGHTEWYVIRRLAASGSVDDKQEIQVRVSYGLDKRVSRISTWGF